MLKSGGKELVEISNKLKKNQKGKNKKTTYKQVAIANLTSGLLTGGACAAGIVSLPFAIPVAITSLGAYGTIDWLLNYRKELEWDRLFENMGLKNKEEEKPELIESIKTNYGTCHSFTCPIGLSVDDFEKQLGRFETYLNCKKIKINFNNKRIFVRVFSEKLKREYPFAPYAKGILPFPIGVNTKGPIIEDLANTETCHLFICGETGSGKSTALNVFLCNLILTKTDKEVELYIADGKGGSELWDYEDCRHTKCFAKNLYEINLMMKKVVQIMKYRQRMLRENKCKNINIYNKKIKTQMSRMIVVFDEINIVKSAITKEDKNTAKEIMADLSLLCQQARSVGITLALCTQLPYADLVGGLITGNIPLKVGFKVEKQVHSEMIIGSDELIELKGLGHGIVKIGMDKREFQGYYIDPHEIEELLQGTYRAKGREQTDIEQIQGPKETGKPKNENIKASKRETYKKTPKKQIKDTIEIIDAIDMEEVIKVKDQGEIKDYSFLNRFK